MVCEDMSDEACSAGGTVGAVAARRAGSLARLAGGPAGVIREAPAGKRVCSARFSCERRLVPGRGWPAAAVSIVAAQPRACTGQALQSGLLAAQGGGRQWAGDDGLLHSSTDSRVS